MSKSETPLLLSLNTLLIKEHVAVLKLHDEFDIFNPADGRKIGHAAEVLSGFSKLLRIFVNKRMLPTTIEITDEQGALVCQLRRGFAVLRPQVDVFDGTGRPVGYLRSKILTLGGGFWAHLPSGEQVADVKGNWIGWEFEFKTPDGNIMGTITKKWAGLGKELFTSADNYIVTLNPDFAGNLDTRLMLLASAIAVDSVFKEKQ